MELFIDTSTKFLIIILLKKDKIVDSVFLDNNKRHTEQTVENINSLLIKHNIWWNNINAIYATTGPGSYTGVRVTLTIVKTIKLINNDIKIFGINSLLYHLGKPTGIGIVSLSSNKYYMAEYQDFKIKSDIKVVDDLFIKDNNIKQLDIKTMYIDNFLILKNIFSEIKNIDSFKISY